jgi:transposase
VDKKIKTLTKELKVIVPARRWTLIDLPGVGPVVAAQVLADVGHVARFADRNRFVRDAPYLGGVRHIRSALWCLSPGSARGAR